MGLLLHVAANKLFDNYLKSDKLEVVESVHIVKTSVKIVGPCEIGFSFINSWVKPRIDIELEKVETIKSYAPVYASRVSPEMVKQISEHYVNKYLDYWHMKYQINVVPSLTLNDFINIGEGSLEDNKSLN